MRSASALQPTPYSPSPQLQRRTAHSSVILALAAAVMLLASACHDAREPGAGGVPDAVVRAGVALEHGGVPEHLVLSVRPLADRVSAADRANGVLDLYDVAWRGLDRASDGLAQDVQGSFSLRRLASGVWYLSDGYRQTLLNADGQIATTGEDLSGTYTGRTEAHGYDGIELELHRSGTTHTGTFRYQYYGTPRTVHVLALHRLVAHDPYVQELNGVVQLWMHAGGAGKDSDLLPDKAVELRPDVIACTWIPPRDPVIVTLRRR